jgi:hypothetical protein
LIDGNGEGKYQKKGRTVRKDFVSGEKVLDSGGKDLDSGGKDLLVREKTLEGKLLGNKKRGENTWITW